MSERPFSVHDFFPAIYLLMASLNDSVEWNGSASVGAFITIEKKYVFFLLHIEQFIFVQMTHRIERSFPFPWAKCVWSDDWMELSMEQKDEGKKRLYPSFILILVFCFFPSNPKNAMRYFQNVKCSSELGCCGCCYRLSRDDFLQSQCK